MEQSGTTDDTGAQTAYAHLAGALGGTAKGFGVAQGWIAPVALFDAAGGFGEECWTDGLPVTVIASRLHGTQVTWHCGKAAGRTSGPHCIAVQPRGTPNHARARGAIRFAQTFLPDALIDRVADSIRPGARASGMIRDDLIFHPDREFEALVHRHVRTAQSGASALELEASAILLIGTLLRRYHGFGEPQVTRGGLAPWQLRRVCDAMEAQIDADIGLDMLAEIAGCSQSHFSRAFKQSAGMSPFRWLLERRIDRAKALLSDPRQGLAEIALAVGFAAQPQFTTAFRRATGTTPGHWRRQRLA